MDKRSKGPDETAHAQDDLVPCILRLSESISLDAAHINPFMPSGFFYHTSLDESTYSLRVSGQFLLLPCFIEMPVINANSDDPDQMPRLRRLILVYTVCQCPIYGTLSTNRLIYHKNKYDENLEKPKTHAQKPPQSIKQIKVL